MPDIVGVRFSRTGHIHYFDPSKLDLSLGDRVVVETEDGQREGEVVITPDQFLFSDFRGPLSPVLRKNERP
jgi:cell fate regulator YaaT (PSP1 superfamily)